MGKPSLRKLLKKHSKLIVIVILIVFLLLILLGFYLGPDRMWHPMAE